MWSFVPCITCDVVNFNTHRQLLHLIWPFHVLLPGRGGKIFQTIPEWARFIKADQSKMRSLQNTVFPRIIAGVDYSREAIISNITLWKSNNMGFFSSLINFQILNRDWPILLDLIVFQLDREGIKGREGGERGGRGVIFQGTAIIRGNTVISRSSWFPWELFLRNEAY